MMGHAATRLRVPAAPKLYSMIWPFLIFLKLNSSKVLRIEHKYIYRKTIFLEIFAQKKYIGLGSHNIENRWVTMYICKLFIVYPIKRLTKSQIFFCLKMNLYMKRHVKIQKYVSRNCLCFINYPADSHNNYPPLSFFSSSPSRWITGVIRMNVCQCCPWDCHQCGCHLCGWHESLPSVLTSSHPAPGCGQPSHANSLAHRVQFSPSNKAPGEQGFLLIFKWPQLSNLYRQQRTVSTHYPFYALNVETISQHYDDICHTLAPVPSSPSGDEV